MDSLIVQGQLTEVPLNFDIFAIKVVGQTIQSFSTNKLSKLQSNGILILDLVNFFILYLSLMITSTLKVEAKVVPNVKYHNFGTQWSFWVIIKRFSGGHEKIWGFHLAYPPCWPIWTVFFQFSPSWLLLGPCFYKKFSSGY